MKRLQAHVTDLVAGFKVRRLLPAAAQRSVGPFVFFDHFGPVTLPPDASTDVGVHPHIGLATVTYLFEGRMLHRDSLGTVQEITPGAINWMSAGRGIAHSERTPESLRHQARRLHGLQLWVALPEDQEQSEPFFQHVDAASIPQLSLGDVQVRVLVGEALGVRSPVRAVSPTLYLDVRLREAHTWLLPPIQPQLALYSPGDALWVNDELVPAGEMVVLPSGQATTVRSEAAARLVVIGGEALSPPRAMWWNFVATRRELIDVAAQAWADGQFPAVPGETDRIPLPKRNR